MKFIILCDLLPAPVATAGDPFDTVGVRITGAAVDQRDNGTRDPVAELRKLLAPFNSRPLPAPNKTAFDLFCDDLSTAALPLFPWLGGTLEFDFAWLRDERGSHRPATLRLVPLPARAELEIYSLRHLRHAALANLLLDEHVKGFAELEAFRITASPLLKNDPIDEIHGDARCFSYEAFVAGLSSLPAPIPHGALNLARFATLEAFERGYSLIAAPRLRSRGSAGQTIEPDLEKARLKKRDGDWIAVIPYKAGFKDYPIEAYCKAISAPIIQPTDESFLDRPTQWVRSTHLSGGTPGEGAGVESQDWLEKLPDIVADIFDLPRVLIDVIAADAGAGGSQLAQHVIAASPSAIHAARLITQTVLIAMRDVVGPGCMAVGGANPPTLEGPFGSPAYTTIFRLLGEAGLSAPNSGWGVLAAAIARQDHEFRSRLSAAPDVDNPDASRKQWLQILGEVLGPPLGLPTDTFEHALAQQVEGDRPGGFYAEPLRRVVGAALQPQHTIAIQMAIWRRAILAEAVPMPVDVGSWCAQAAAKLSDLSDRGFRVAELIRRSNIDLPWTDEHGLWSDGSPSALDTNAFKLKLRASLEAYVLGTLCAARSHSSRLEEQYETFHRRTGVLTSQLADRLSVLIEQICARRIDALFSAPADEAGLSPDAHGVTFQIDRLITGGGTDFNEDLAGYGFLMRRTVPPSTPGIWRSLTSCFADGAPDMEKFAIEFQGMPRHVLAAHPVSRIGNMPTATVVYNNRPIVGDITADSELQSPPSDKRIFALRKPALQDKPSDEALLPFLAYGAAYELAPFAISNHGAVPVALQAGDYPALVAVSNPMIPNEQHVVRRFRYLRRTGIGALDIAPQLTPRQESGVAYNPWEAPRETRGIASEIIKVDSGGARKDSTPTVLLLSGDIPIGLTAADGTKCGETSVEIGAPLTSLEDFDRWLALDEALAPAKDQPVIAALRRTIRTDYQRAVESLHDVGHEQGRPRKLSQVGVKRFTDASLQDPAVSKLYVRVTRKRRGGKATNDTVGGFFEWPLETASPARPRKPISLRSTIADRSAALFDAATRTVSVTPGDVVLVELFAAVEEHLVSGPVLSPGDTVRKRSFDTCVQPQERFGAHALFSRYAFAIEAATTALATVSHESVLAHIVDAERREADEHVGDIRLDFRRPAPDPDAGVAVATDAIGAIQVGTQAWRWTGRTLSAFPFSAFSGSPKASLVDVAPSLAQTGSSFPLLWDVEAFAERLDETLDDKTMIVPLSPPDASGAAAPVRVSLVSPQRAQIARYMRFRITTHSRYAAAYRKAGRVIGPRRSRFVSGPSSEPWATDWVRVFRAAQPPVVVPKPAIRALIPLTRAPQLGSDQGNTPTSTVSGILAIVDGAWFEHTGLTDGLIAGFEISRRGDGTAAAEIGPDAIVRRSGVGASGIVAPVNPSATLQTASLEVAGPIGHSYDTGTATGLFHYSSFFVRPPPFASVDGGAWWMGKVAFRRIVVAEGMDGYWAGDPQKTIDPVVSDTAHPQVAITLHDISGPETGPVTLTVRGTADQSGSLVETLQMNLEKRDGIWNLHLFGRSDPFSAVSVKQDVFDLRIVARRRLSIGKDSFGKSVSYAWYEVLILARPDGGHWQMVAEQAWFRDERNGKNVPVTAPMTLSVAASGLEYEQARTNSFLQVSDATEGRWSQFLPNAETLARSANVRLDPDVKIARSGQRFTISVAGGAPTWLALRNTKAGDDDQGLVNLLLVTKRVESVAGTEEEAYVGLCYAEPYDPGKPLELSWLVANAKDEPKLPRDAQLLGRIITVRARRPTITETDIASWKTNAWTEMFPIEEDDPPIDGSRVFGPSGVPDAGLQIIEIYMPIPISNSG